jgi:hypothetical protein
MALHYLQTVDLKLNVYSNSDWDGCVVTRRSTTGTICTLGGAAVSWSSKKQSFTAMSSCESEYAALTSAVKESLWLQDLLSEVGVPQLLPTRVYVDNTAAIASSQNPVLHARTKHGAIPMHFVRERVTTGQVSVLYTPTVIQIADFLTKSVPVTVLHRCRTGARQEPDEGRSGTLTQHQRGSVESAVLHWLRTDISNM